MPNVLSSLYPFHGKIVTVRVDDVRLPDGHVTQQEVVEHRESMTVVALDSEDRLVLVRQYRHAVGEVLLETAAGSIDDGETPEEAVNRELAEETGYRARQVARLGSFYLAPGWATEHMHVFLARDLYESPEEGDEDERIEVVHLSIPEWEEMIAQGAVRDCKSLGAWHLARRYLWETRG
ncbi:MAG: NUDIX hydrolase [Armatimonadota bacterium]